MFDRLSEIALRYKLDLQLLEQFAVSNMKKYGVQRKASNNYDLSMDMDHQVLTVHCDNVDLFVSGFRRYSEKNK